MIYISGKITGDSNWESNFIKAEIALEEAGWDKNEIVSPRLIGELVGKEIDSPTWKDYMKEDLKQLLECTQICMLPGWEDSKGAKLEKHIAEQMGFEVFYADSLGAWCLNPSI